MSSVPDPPPVDPNDITGVIYVTINGVTGTVQKCKYCQHTNPLVCPICKPYGEMCWGCWYNAGGVPVTTTIGAVGRNDPPPGTETMNPGGQCPKGLNSGESPASVASAATAPIQGQG